MNTAFAPSGETDAFSAVARIAAVESERAHVYVWISQLQRRFCAENAIDRWSLAKSNDWNGRRFASARPPDAATSAAASLAWSNIGSRVLRAGSTM